MDLVSTFPSLAEHDLVQEEEAASLPPFSSLSLEPPSFRNLYDGAAPIIFPSGPVTLQSLLPAAVCAPTTPLSSSLRSLTIRGHSLPLLCPPLVLLACPLLQHFSMSGHSLGSSRHHTLRAIHNFQQNFLLPALSLASCVRPCPPSRLTSLSLLDPYSGDSVATMDLFSQTVTPSSLLPSSLALLPTLCPFLSRFSLHSSMAITDPGHLSCLHLLPHLSHLTLDHCTPPSLTCILTSIGPRLVSLHISRTSLSLASVLTACPNLHSLTLHTSTEEDSMHLHLTLPNLSTLDMTAWLDANSLGVLLQR